MRSGVKLRRIALGHSLSLWTEIWRPSISSASWLAKRYRVYLKIGDNHMRRLFVGLLLSLPASAAAGWAQQGSSDPMARFAPLVGEWKVRHILWSQTGQAPSVFEGGATIYFVAGGTVLVVDEVTSDRKYRFVGYHAFDTATAKYLNWTASSTIVLAWGEGEWDNSSEVFRTRRLDPRTGKTDSLIGRGVWTIVDANLHVFRAVRFGPDGTEIPFKEERYTRVTPK